MFANGSGDVGSIPDRVPDRVIPKTLKIPDSVIQKTLKMVLETSLLNTQHTEVYIMGKVEQSRERSSALPYTSM